MTKIFDLLVNTIVVVILVAIVILVQSQVLCIEIRDNLTSPGVSEYIYIYYIRYIKQIEPYLKKIDLIISHEHFLEVSELLRKYKIDGMTFYGVKGRGRSRQEEVSAGRGIARTVPEFIAGTKIELIVEDSVVQAIIVDVRTILSKGSFPFGKIFVSDVVEVHDINTHESSD